MAYGFQSYFGKALGPLEILVPPKDAQDMDMVHQGLCQADLIFD